MKPGEKNETSTAENRPKRNRRGYRNKQAKKDVRVNSAHEMKIMVVNCRSLCNKVDKFRTMLEIYDPEIVVATETWLDEG